jgi:aarF domain-containing kinase
VSKSSTPSGSAPPTSAWSRSTSLLKLGAKLAAKEVGGRLRGDAPDANSPSVRLLTQVAQARDIVASLGQLKGAAMKAGQLLSMELRDVLPDEVIQVLQTLQDAGKAVAFEDIHAILKEELGETVLAQLDVVKTPLASASIGQVHRAVWTDPQGEKHDLVLKIQFRGIAETIDSDLAVLEKIARLFLKAQFKNIDLGSVFTELKEVLKRETNYHAELESLLAYRAYACNVPGLHAPVPYPDLSTSKVLAMSFEPGLKLDAFLAQFQDSKTRQTVAHQILDLYFREFFDWGIVQTDANFANFLFRPMPDGSITLVLLDFGATRTYAPAFIKAYRELMLACFEGRDESAIDLAQSLALIDPRESDASKAQLVALMRIVLRVFRPEAQPVDFTSKQLVQEPGEAAHAFYKGLKHSPPPAQLLFLHRKLGGVFSLVKALRGKIDLMPYWERV